MEKVCSLCKRSLTLDRFYPRNDGRQGRASVTSMCRDCRPARMRENSRKTPDIEWSSQLKYRYGITLAEYKERLAAQGNGCAICGTATTQRQGTANLPVDHCKKTGTVRGILCDACNRGIGFFLHDPKMLRDAAAYLERHESRVQDIRAEVARKQAESAAEVDTFLNKLLSTQEST
jgi:Recombination endonuclease VII